MVLISTHGHALKCIVTALLVLKALFLVVKMYCVSHIKDSKPGPNRKMF